MKMIIGGKWVDQDEKIDVLQPFDGSVSTRCRTGTAEDVDAAITAAAEGLRDQPHAARAQADLASCKKTADIMRALRGTGRDDRHGRDRRRSGRRARRSGRCVNTHHDLGRGSAPHRRRDDPVRQRRAARRTASATTTGSRSGSSRRSRRSTIPLNLVAHKLGPAIAGGNSVVLKPATVTPLSALKLAEALLEAGLPRRDRSTSSPATATKIGDALVSDPRVRMVSFTGGVEAGQRIMTKAGLKKIGMELGSNSPVIVMADCGARPRRRVAVSGAFWAVGQNCIGVQRVYVERPIYDEFRDKFVARTKKYKVGHQARRGHRHGPDDHRGRGETRSSEWVDRGGVGGAKVLTGGTAQRHDRRSRRSLGDMPRARKLGLRRGLRPGGVALPGRHAWRRRSNSSNAVELRPPRRRSSRRTSNSAFYAVKNMDVGGIIVNDSTDYRVDLMPFGGVKNSGLGREGIKFALHGDDRAQGGLLQPVTTEA